MKKCGCCNKFLNLSEFYKHKMMLDGHLNFCKSCTKIRITSHRNMNLDRIRGYDRKRSKTNKWRVKQAKYLKSKKGKLVKKKSNNNWILRNQHKRRAHIKFWNIFRLGKIKKQPCVVCGETNKIHAHHEDYDKPLSVIWLCPLHHRDKHIKPRKNT